MLDPQQLDADLETIARIREEANFLAEELKILTEEHDATSAKLAELNARSNAIDKQKFQ